jgi:peptidoglycan/xylan/chitin deacetylase (PgdA/CDA1 family)
MKHAVIRAGLETLYFSGAHLALRPLLGGVGAILMLHHVRPPRRAPFQPNRLLEISPAFLEGVITELRRAAVDIVTLDEMHRRLTTGDAKRRRFVCLTFDDGYRDNLEYAYPILKRHQVPFAVYVASSFPDGAGELWWLALEAVIARNERVELVMEGRKRSFDCRTAQSKRIAFEAIYWWLRSLPSEAALRSAIRALAATYGIDIGRFCRELCMSWEELAELAADPLVTIGAHTISHPRLSRIPEEAVRTEMQGSVSAIEAALGVRPVHLAYPVGDATSAGAREFALARELGFKTAVTTRPGVLFAEHAAHLTALPRLSLNGEYQRLRYLQVLLSGAATGLWTGFRRVDAQ